MSRNRVKIWLLAAMLGTAVFARDIDIPTSVSDDELIVRALFYTEIKAYDAGRQLYKVLYKRTGEKAFLYREAASSLMGDVGVADTIAQLEAYDKQHPDEVEIKRLLIPLYLMNRALPEAKRAADALTSLSKKGGDWDLAANPYLYAGEFEKAASLLKQAFAYEADEEILLRLASVLDDYLHRRKEAIRYLETYRRVHGDVGIGVYYKLLSLYVKENDIDGVLSVYLDLYEKHKDEKYLEKIIRAYALKGDVDGAIAFLEKHRSTHKLLYKLYKSKKMYDKALALAKRFYRESKDPKWLAEMGILYFERAKDKNDKHMIAKVIKMFDKALAEGVDDSLYLNYYGYTLIDKDIDVKKGMEILQKALKQQPDNSYYLDSLAWGYYKEGECKKAYEVMRKVVAQEGLKVPEIAQHWQKIKACSKK